MKQINLTEVFCEVLSGVALIIVIIPLLDILDYSSLSNTWAYIECRTSLSNFGILIVFSYILGLLIDAIGLTFGEWFLDDLICNKPTDFEMARFWQNVDSHVLSYRDTQWAYYSCYRNLFIIFFPGTVFWTISVWKTLGWHFGLPTLSIFIAFEWILYRSMKALLKIYYNIAKSLSINGAR